MRLITLVLVLMSIMRGAAAEPRLALQSRGSDAPGDATDLTVQVPGAASPLALGAWLGATQFRAGTIAALRAWPITGLPSGAGMRVSGYYEAGDEGGGDFTWAPSARAADDGCTVIKPAAVSEAGRWLRTLRGSVISVKQCGAKGDGAANDTAAIQAAIKWAESTRSGTSYWSSTDLGAVYLNPGLYMINGLDVHRQIRLYGDAPGSATLGLLGGSNRSVIRSHAPPLSDSDAGPGYGQPIFENFTISGYAQAQISKSDGIEFVDASYSGSTRYVASGRIRTVVIAGVRDSGIYIGGNRNLSFIDGVIVNYAGKAGLYIAGGADVALSNSSIGANGTGVVIYAASAVSIVNSAIYNNTGHGLVVSGISGSYVLVTGTTIGANGQHGVVLDSENGGSNLVLGLSNVHLTDNSQVADGSFSNIYLRNFKQVMLSNVWVNNTAPAKQGAYVIDNDASGYVGVDNLIYDSVTAAPFRKAPFRNPSRIIGGSDPLTGTFHLTAPLRLTGQSAPSGSGDTAGAVGDVRLVGNTLYWKTPSGWVRAVGSRF